jgi:hypothetical protein
MIYFWDTPDICLTFMDDGHEIEAVNIYCVGRKVALQAVVADDTCSQLRPKLNAGV